MTLPWDFEYVPLPPPDGGSRSEADFVLATRAAVDPESLVEALADVPATVEQILSVAPLHWYRVRTLESVARQAIAQRASRVADVRYVTSALRPSCALGGAADWESAGAGGASWKVRPEREHAPAEGEGHWFLREIGADVDRAVCGTGAGTRLAVVDDDAREADALELDREIPVGVDAPPRGSAHGATMVAWAVGTRGRAATALPPFVGVAPDASPRLYAIPKAGNELFWFPLAVVLAVRDGADVVVCATYVEGTTSPLLDDACEFAARAGRRGLGSVLVLPTGREVSSPPGSVHASLTLGFAEPASDPRVLCVAPSGRDGAWFLWPDKLGRVRPFANRGPAVAVAAPGDDMAFPFAADGRLGHAESSGASAVAAGVALLVIGKNPTLRAAEVRCLLTSTARRCPPVPERALADPFDVLPRGGDPDAHDARTGYGRVSARAAVLAAKDPFAAALLRIGEESASRRFVRCRLTDARLAGAYSTELAELAARVTLEGSAFSLSVRSLVRHLRLVVHGEGRAAAQPRGAIVRALALLVRGLRSHAGEPGLRAELDGASTRLSALAAGADEAAAFELVVLGIARDAFACRDALETLSAEGAPPQVGGLPRSA